MKTITDHEGKKHLFSVPITQDVTKEEKEKLKDEKKVALRCPKVSDKVLAVIEEPTFFDNRREEISARVFGTLSAKHYKVERIMAQGDFLITGKALHCVTEVKFNDGFDNYRMTPKEVNG